MNDTRLEEFNTEVAKLGGSGGLANPDRWVFRVGVFLTGLGLAITLTSFILTASAPNAVNHLDLVVSAILGVCTSLVGVMMVLISTFRRFMRYWLVRLVYEHRAQTDRVVESELQ